MCIKKMLTGVDWDTPAKEAKLGSHWRVVLGVVGGAVVSTLFWHAFFPHTFWFIKLWAGFATGATVGIIPGTWWQLRDGKRRPATSGHLIHTTFHGWGCFAVIAMLWCAPEMYIQESERAHLRSLEVQDISKILVHIDGQQPLHIQSAELIASFVEHAKHAELFYPSHEGSLVELQIVIETKDGASIQCEGRVPEFHQDSFSLYFHPYVGQYEIIFPHGGDWHDSLPQPEIR